MSCFLLSFSRAVPHSACVTSVASEDFDSTPSVMIQAAKYT